MTDRQFDSYQQGLLRYLETIEEEIKNSNGKPSKQLEKLMADIKAQLQRP